MLKCLVKQFHRLPRTSPALGSQSCLSCFMLAFLLTPSISRTKDTWVVRKLACSLGCPSHSGKLMVDAKLCKHLSSLQSIGLCLLPIASPSLQRALFSNSASLSPQPSLQHLDIPKYFLKETSYQQKTKISPPYKVARNITLERCFLTDPGIPSLCALVKYLLWFILFPRTYAF